MATTVNVSAADVDLFHLAARTLGDATQWHRIARLNQGLLAGANGLTDPRIGGILALVIPAPDKSQTGGVPTQ